MDDTVKYPDFKEKQKTLFKRSAKLKTNATESELIFKNRLSEAGIRFMFQKGFINGTYYYIADFYLPKPNKTVIEIDGSYHSSDAQRVKDRIRDKYFKDIRNIKVIRIKNSDVNDFDLSIFHKE